MITESLSSFIPMPGAMRPCSCSGPGTCGHRITPKMLVLDSHRAQITDNARTIMEQECNTTVITIGGGLTPVLQPLDVLFNKPFKKKVDDLFNEHLTANLDAYLNGTIPAKRRVLMTRWVGRAWQEVSASLQEQIKAVSKSIDISIPADGSKNNLVKLRGLSEYRIARGGAAANEQDVKD